MATRNHNPPRAGNPLNESAATAVGISFDVPVTNTADYQTFCPGYSLDTVTAFFAKPKELEGYLSTGDFFSSNSKSAVETSNERITHQSPRIAAVYFFKEGTDQGRKGTFILAKGFHDPHSSGQWEPMIAVFPRGMDGDACYTLKS